MRTAMRITCHRRSLAAALATARGVIPARTPKTILKNVKLRLTEDRATLLATNSEVGIRSEVSGVESDSVGEVLLPAKQVTEILREVQDDVIVLEVDEGGLRIRTADNEFKLAVDDPAEFPDVAMFDDDAYWTVPGRQLKQAIQRTIFAIDTKNARYALGGVLVEVSPATITLAATDCHRLAVAQTPCSQCGEPSAGQRPVVPAKAMRLIEQSVGKGEQEVHLAVHDDSVLVRSGTSTIYARLVAGRFPKYRDVIPRNPPICIELVAGPLLSAVQQSAMVASDKRCGVDFAFADGNLILASVGADAGCSRVELPVSYDGEPITITFDPKFVADFLKVLKPSASLSLGLTAPNDPVVFRVGSDYTYVLMPMARWGR